LWRKDKGGYLLCKQCEKQIKTFYIMAISNTLSGLFGGFTSNISKLRKAAMDYFASEGIALPFYAHQARQSPVYQPVDLQYEAQHTP
jgi:hypothetical protein